MAAVPSVLCLCGTGVLKLIFCCDIYGMFDVQGFIKSLHCGFVFAIGRIISFGVSNGRIESVTMWFIS